MAFVMGILWLIALILLIFDWRTEKTRWIAFIPFCGGFGALAETVKDNIRPYFLTSNSLSPSLNNFLQSIFNISYIMNHIVGAYAMFVAAIVYCGLFQKRTVNRLKLILLIPVFVTIAVSSIWPIIQINWIVLASWAVPYIFIGTAFLFRSYYLEITPKIKTDKLIILVAISGPTVTVAFTNYLARCFGYNDLYNSNIFVIGVLFIFIMIVIYKNNFLGLRVKVEKDRIDSAIKAAISGTAILNHTIKNEVMKISMSAEMCKESGLKEDQESYVNHILESSEYLLGMTKKLHSHLHEIVVKLEDVNVASMLNRIVKLNESTYSHKEICLETSISDNSLMCQMDKVHVAEVVNSLVKNSTEGIKAKGRIVLGLVENRKTILITVEDDGEGISPDNLPYVLDPFYTTKKLTMNFGLGLTHAYNIMKEHKGFMEIESTEGKGTLVKLFFPYRGKRYV